MHLCPFPVYVLPRILGLYCFIFLLSTTYPKAIAVKLIFFTDHQTVEQID